MKSNGAPAIIVCVYGNRDYDDALLELKDIIEDKGFKVVSAAAFIAQHSIFPQVGMNRPDENDMKLAVEFSEQNLNILNPRKTEKDKCIICGRCIVVCPQKARHFGGLLYKIAGKRFVKANSAPKEPELIYVTN